MRRDPESENTGFPGRAGGERARGPAAGAGLTIRMLTTSTGDNTAAARFTFRERHRLTHAREFEAVYAGKCRKNRGTLMVFTLPNALGHPRLGLAVGGRVGSAVVRSRVKRLIREAFRLRQFDLAPSATGGYDLIVSVRGSTVPVLAALGDTLVELVAQADTEWRRRARAGTDHSGVQHEPGRTDHV